MRQLVILSVASALVLAASAAVAAPAGEFAERVAPRIAVDSAEAPLPRPRHPCHGMANGTAEAECGTTNGGPVGGLF